jgi:hypothetical protein
MILRVLGSWPRIFTDSLDNPHKSVQSVAKLLSFPVKNGRPDLFQGVGSRAGMASFL